MPNSTLNPEVCDATDAHSSTTARPIKIPFYSTAYPKHPNNPSIPVNFPVAFRNFAASYTLIHIIHGNNS
jgi:hypothetical protein